MTLFRKAALSLVVTSIALAPIAASAAPAVGGVQATPAIAGENELEGSSSWLIGLLGLVAGVVAIVIVSDNNDDEPTSP